MTMVRCACVRSFMWNSGVCYPRFIQFALSCYAVHKPIVNIMKVYIEKNNVQVELIRFRKT